MGAAQGNPNYAYYSLAASEYGVSGNMSYNSTLGNGAANTCIFYDITQGDMDMNCAASGRRIASRRAKHGRYSMAAQAERRYVRTLLNDCRAALQITQHGSPLT